MVRFLILLFAITFVGCGDNSATLSDPEWTDLAFIDRLLAADTQVVTDAGLVLVLSPRTGVGFGPATHWPCFAEPCDCPWSAITILRNECGTKWDPSIQVRKMWLIADNRLIGISDLPAINFASRLGAHASQAAQRVEYVPGREIAVVLEIAGGDIAEPVLIRSATRELPDSPCGQ
jgi:hypothetical protein